MSAPKRPAPPASELAASNATGVAGVSVGPSVLGDEGLFAIRDFDIGETVFAEQCMARVEAIEKYQYLGLEGLKERFDELASEESGAKIQRLLNSGLFLGSGSEGEYRRSMHCSWSRHTWPTGTPEEQARMADALTILSYNSYSSIPGNVYQMVYPIMSKANHSCAPNVAVLAPPEGVGEVLCICPIKSGDEITSSYLCDSDLVSSVSRRQEILYSGWGFKCGCPRCTARLDDTRRFSCSSLAGALPQWTEASDDHSNGCKERVKSTCPGFCRARCRSDDAELGSMSACSKCGKQPDAEASAAWIRREAEGEAFYGELPEGLFNAWAKLEDFADAHPKHGLSGRWRFNLSYYLEKEAKEAEDPAEVDELKAQVVEHRQFYQQCLENLLPERRKGGLLGKP
eukprot:TRINITY_DN79052_c0_g1_i1.p1 TRINITY_DN79052_c0_g1~~TRINITY_DN79052_c0_g1_i1.p1  ORF type:complete len:400 (-),score=81.40 TRINITY_DN79052_c0_g1_i1:369-1568(-)